MPYSIARTFCLLVAFAFSPLFAQAPAGYYSAAEGLRGQALENALRNIISGHTSLSYNGAKDRLWDTVDHQNGLITCIYSGRTSTNLNADSNSMNAEHTWPQSRGAGSTPPRSDLHHLFVTDSTWNSRRGSLRFATVTNPTATSPIGAKVNSSQGFEPPDEYKGDVARVIFYFAVRYNRDVRNGAVLSGSDGSTSDDHMGELDDLIAWHFADPPSDYERHRNNRIYSIQGNRNPFIDNPDFLSAWLELGPSAPSIATTTIPAIPDFANATSIRATITADASIQTATAHWRIGSSGTFTVIPMTMVSGSLTNGTWQSASTIPVLAGNTRVEYFVQATDSSGLEGRDPSTGQKFFIVRPPTPPSIALSTSPTQPRFDQTTTFRATITSELGIPANAASLHYRLGNQGPFTQIPLLLQSGSATNGLWATAEIPPMPGETLVQFYAEATDTAGTTTRQPTAGTSSFVVFEPTPPVVSATIQPAQPRVGEAITFTAAIASQQGLDASTVVAVYTSSDGRAGELPMTRISGSLTSGNWSASLPFTAPSPGTVLSYGVRAADTLGREARDPALGLRAVTIAEMPTELDISGYTLTETDARTSVVFPQGTTVPANGFVIVARQASKSQFESLWGPLPANVVYINAHDIIGGNGLVINGGEVFTLDDASGSRIDGPAPNTTLSAQNARVYRTTTASNTWERGNASAANPGLLEIPGTGAGLIITEICDPTTGFMEAFVELFFDAPLVEVEETGDTMLFY